MVVAKLDIESKERGWYALLAAQMYQKCDSEFYATNETWLYAMEIRTDCLPAKRGHKS